jgi:Cytochrome c554 and c-prime
MRFSSSAQLCLFWLFGLCSLGAAAACAGMPRASRLTQRPGRTVAKESLCGGCHAEEEREWDGSMHHASFTSPDFQESWSNEPFPFCAECHAPDRKTLAAVGEHLGIGCTSCHQVADAHGLPGASLQTSKTVTKSCAPCHDFPVPNAQAFLQSTVREHAQSAYASTSCVACHMPQTNGRRNHSFSVSRNTELLRNAIAITDVKVIDSAVALSLRTVGVGHRFPTGDIFRRLSASIVASDAKGAVVCAETMYFNRNWSAHQASVRDGTVETLTQDNRLTNTPRAIRVPCTGTPVDVQVTLDYARGKSATEGFFSAFETTQLRDEHFSLR